MATWQKGTSPVSKRKTTLLDLNDDCLMALFSWVSPLDMCTVRKLCSRLKNLTEDYFGRNHRFIQFDNVDSEMKNGELLKLLSSFGQQIDVLTVDASNSKKLSSKLDDFCKKHNLQHLKLVRFVFDEDFIRDRFELFVNVDKLTLDDCRSTVLCGSLDDLVKKCTTLKHLELLRGTQVSGTFLEQTYPMLQGLNVNSIATLDSSLFQFFVAMNPQLEELKIVNCRGLGRGLDNNIFDMIGNHLVELKSLTLRCNWNTSEYAKNMMSLLQLPKLQELEIECHEKEIVQFVTRLSDKNQMESLGLKSVKMTENMINALGQLKSVKKLKLDKIVESVNSGSIQSIAVQLPILKQFHVSSSVSLTFDDIVELVENATKLEDLMITSCPSIIPFDEAQFNRLVETCAKRANKLRLTVHIRYDDLNDMKRTISGEMRRNYSEVVRFVELPSPAFDDPNDSSYCTESVCSLDSDDNENV